MNRVISSPSISTDRILTLILAHVNLLAVLALKGDGRATLRPLRPRKLPAFRSGWAEL